MPQSYVRLSAGRETMNEQMQALAFLAGANSTFYGEKIIDYTQPCRAPRSTIIRQVGYQSAVARCIEHTSPPVPEHTLFYDACA